MSKIRWNENLTEDQREALDLAHAALAEEFGEDGYGAIELRAAFSAKPLEFTREMWVRRDFAEGKDVGRTFVAHTGCGSRGDEWVRCRVHGIEILDDEEGES